ncbi:PREDICTED: uncharacterized protein LOC107073023 [Polistes dominula]|uniref:Uncharacterized protein LOC107073023 n=1 Tax=Polistes dominula TaxID=743375 RepID=A0ABM1J8V5_POLDO|nr:PREDICTED: uncharacterized protein LOC107073023 [Polistes dominula]
MSIIKVKYHEYASRSNDDVDDDKDVETVCTDKEILVNVDCPIGLILDYVRQVIRLDKGCTIDFCDEINSQLRNLSIAEPSTSCLHFLQPNNTYFVVTFASKFCSIIYYINLLFHDNILYIGHNNEVTTLVPLLNTKTGKKCTEILKRIRQKKSAQK